MFVGYQGENPCFIGQSVEELENLPCVVLDEIREVEFAEMYNGKIYLKEEDLTSAKMDAIREVRNSYLTQYVDPYIMNERRFSEMKQEEQDQILAYRDYLKNYTEQENWFEQNPMTLDEFKAQ